MQLYHLLQGTLQGAHVEQARGGQGHALPHVRDGLQELAAAPKAQEHLLKEAAGKHSQF